MNPFREGQGTLLFEVVQVNMPFTEVLFGQFFKGMMPNLSTVAIHFLSPVRERLQGSGAATIDFEKMFVESNGRIDRFVDIGDFQLFYE